MTELLRPDTSNIGDATTHTSIVYVTATETKENTWKNVLALLVQ